MFITLLINQADLKCVETRHKTPHTSAFLTFHIAQYVDTGQWHIMSALDKALLWINDKNDT